MWACVCVHGGAGWSRVVCLKCCDIKVLWSLPPLSSAMSPFICEAHFISLPLSLTPSISSTFFSSADATCSSCSSVSSFVHFYTHPLVIMSDMKTLGGVNRCTLKIMSVLHPFFIESIYLFTKNIIWIYIYCMVDVFIVASERPNCSGSITQPCTLTNAHSSFSPSSAGDRVTDYLAWQCSELSKQHLHIVAIISWG